MKVRNVSHNAQLQMTEEETQWPLSKDGWRFEGLLLVVEPCELQSMLAHENDVLAGGRYNYLSSFPISKLYIKSSLDNHSHTRVKLMFPRSLQACSRFRMLVTLLVMPTISGANFLGRKLLPVPLQRFVR